MAKVELMDRDHEGNPFLKCIECERPIQEMENYLVEKAYQKYPKLNKEITVFEFAICMDCAIRRSGEMSEHSQRVMQEYLKPYQNKAFSEGDEMKCLVTNKSVEETNSYQVSGLFSQGKPAVFFVFSEEALEEINELISDETRDMMDGFIGNHFGVPPEWQRSPVLIL